MVSDHSGSVKPLKKEKTNMAKNILILSASLRASSNSEALANAFADGARAAGHTVEVISLRGKQHRVLPRLPRLPDAGQVRDR